MRWSLQCEQVAECLVPGPNTGQPEIAQREKSLALSQGRTELLTFTATGHCRAAGGTQARAHCQVPAAGGAADTAGHWPRT